MEGVCRETIETNNSVDDVEDNATLRRGYPVAHSLFGIAQTINSSNYMLFIALQKVFSLGTDVAVTIYSGK